MTWWWSWLLGGVGLSGLWLIGNRQWVGWLVCTLNEGLWILYAIITHQWGFIPAAIAYGVVNLRNWNRLRSTDSIVV